MAVGDKGLERLTLGTMLARFVELAADEVVTGNYRFDGLVQIKERAASGAFAATYGQLWIKNTTPAELWYADDAGLESQVMIGAGAEVNDLSVAVTWANIPDANVPASAVTQHRAALLTSIAAGSAGSPSLAWGDGDTGFYELSDGIINFTSQGVGQFSFRTGAILPFEANGAAILNEAASSTNPTLAPSASDLDTGIGWASGDILSLIAGNIEGLRLTELNSGVVQAPVADVAITALSGGGQGGAGILINSYNNITIAAAGGDSVTLPAIFAVNSLIHIKNNGANAVDVFPGSGDDLGAGADTAVSLAVGDGITYIATVANTTWTPFTIAAAATGDVSKVGTPVDNQIGVWTGDGTLEGDANFTWDGNQVLVPLDNDPAAPTIAFGNGDSGFYEIADNNIGIAIAGLGRFIINAAGMGGRDGAAGFVLDEAATATNPTIIANRGDLDSGLGSNGQDTLTLVAGGLDCINIAEVGAARKIGFYVTAPIVLQTGVAVTLAGIHAALVNLGLITA